MEARLSGVEIITKKLAEGQQNRKDELYQKISHF